MLKRDDAFTLLQIAAYAGCERAFARAVEPQTGNLPRAAGLASGNVLKTGMRQYWLFDARMDVPRDVGAATDLSASRARFILEGEGAWRLLQKSIAIDLDPARFKSGQFAQTGLHHSSVLLWRRSETRYDLFALRTYAQSVLDWLSLD